MELKLILMHGSTVDVWKEILLMDFMDFIDEVLLNKTKKIEKCRGIC